MATYWIEFSDQDGESLGAAVIEAADDADNVAVVELAIGAGCAPERAAMHVRRVRFDAVIPDRYRGRLLSPSEAAALISGKVD
jgi:hypothetical protein